MTWFRVDDRFPDHPKAQAAGKNGRALWLAAGPKCAAIDSDGRVDGRMVKLYAAMAEVPAAPSALLLVASGLWHDAKTIVDCDRCSRYADDHGGPLADGDFFFHDWWVYQLDKEGKENPIHRDRELRRKRLNRNQALCRAIRKRDRDRCRYCGVATIWGADRKSGHAGTFDHVDPFGDNSYTNVVVACRRCNGRKRDRTPEEAGMALLPEPQPYEAPTTATRSGSVAPGSGSDPDPRPRDPDPDPDPLTRARETGREPDRAGSGSGSGPGRAGSATGLPDAHHGHDSDDDQDHTHDQDRATPDHDRPDEEPQP